MIHEKLKQRRIELGLTQKQVCDKIGMNRVASISDFERGKKGLSSKKINQLINLYGLDITNDMSDINAINDIFNTINELFNLKQNYKS